MRRTKGPLELCIYPKLQFAETPEDVNECLRLEVTLRNMELRTADLEIPTLLSPVLLRLKYANGQKPEAFWAKRLYVRVIPEFGLGWIGRIWKIEPKTRELWSVPRPDRLDVALAKDAFDHADHPRVQRVTLGVFYATDNHFFRDFYLSH